LLIGGEAFPSALLAELQSLSRKPVLNLYGPTETTIWSTVYQCREEEGRVVPIGVPLANTQVYILDGWGEPVPVGVAGELYLGGAGVARGYLNRPELTAERFVVNPFSSEPGARMYRTGDLGRWLPDGTIEFLGRNDFQLKLRGFRIEPGEIEARLVAHPAVRQAVVIAREDRPGEKRLVAYLTLRDQQPAPHSEALRSWLADSLPDYMLPAVCLTLQALPLTPTASSTARPSPRPTSATSPPTPSSRPAPTQNNASPPSGRNSSPYNASEDAITSSSSEDTPCSRCG
jgi:acyl-coenzyme A synthetase/AMP-(fatty) acid ligase